MNENYFTGNLDQLNNISSKIISNHRKKNFTNSDLQKNNPISLKNNHLFKEKKIRNNKWKL